MGKIKETQSEVFQGHFVMSPDGNSGFVQPTFAGLLEILRGLQYERTTKIDNQDSACEDQTVFEGSEYISDEQLHFRGSEANAV